MDNVLNYVLTLLTQFAGGPGPKENNLVRFGLPAVLWAGLLIVAWSRRRQYELPREKLLVWGFGLGFIRELFMFGHVSTQLLGTLEQRSGFFAPEPFEHALTLAAIVMVAGAYLRYILRDLVLSRRYIQIGLVTALVLYVTISLWWWKYTMVYPDSRFNQAIGGFVFHLVTSVFALVAIVILLRAKGWLRNIVLSALVLFFLSGFLKLFNFFTERAYAYILCPICNNFYVWAIPLLGYVYLREQSIEKKQAQDELGAYKDQLEDLVVERTAELTRANVQLQQEITERTRAEEEIARRNTELAAQNAIAATVSQSLDLDIILDTALDTVLAILDMESGCIYLLDTDGQTLVAHTRRGKVAMEPDARDVAYPCSCKGISRQAVAEMGPVVQNLQEYPADCLSPFVAQEGIQTLVATPLVSKGRALGAVSLGTSRPDAISQDRLELLAGLGQQIGVVIENAHLYQETEAWAKDLALLHEMSVFLSSTLDPGEIHDHIAEQSAKIVGCHVACVFAWDPEYREAVVVSTYGAHAPELDGLRLRLDESSIVAELVTHRKSIPIDDVHTDSRTLGSWEKRSDLRALLGVPVWGADKPLALLFLIEQHAPRHWRPDEIALVESFVNGAAVALENAYLHKQLEWAAALEERQRIAAEMHDGLAQVLSYLGFKVDAAAEFAEAGRIPEMVDEWQEIRDVVDRASREARRSIASLQANPQPRRSLQDSLAEMIAEFRQDDGPSFRLADEMPYPLFLIRDHTIQVLRLVQEALTNARRHAQARQIAVCLECEGDDVRLAVEDDGQGFDADRPPVDSTDHFGLSIMRARAARIGGHVEIESAPGQGTKVVLKWTLDNHGMALDRDRLRFASAR